MEIIDERERQKTNKNRKGERDDVSYSGSGRAKRFCCVLEVRFSPIIEKHMKKNSKSHIFKDLHSTTACFESYNSHSFKIIDKANSKFDLKV